MNIIICLSGNLLKEPQSNSEVLFDIINLLSILFFNEVIVLHIHLIILEFFTFYFYIFILYGEFSVPSPRFDSYILTLDFRVINGRRA